MIVAKKELDYYYSDHIEPIERKPKESNQNKKRKKKKTKAKLKLSIIGMATIGLIVSLFILYRYANITRIRTEITTLEKQKMELVREEEDLLSELETIRSSLKVENDAIIKLGMDYPTEDQLVRVSVKDITLDNNVSDVDESILVKQFKNVVNLVSSLF